MPKGTPTVGKNRRQAAVQDVPVDTGSEAPAGDAQATLDSCKDQIRQSGDKLHDAIVAYERAVEKCETAKRDLAALGFKGSYDEMLRELTAAQYELGQRTETWTNDIDRLTQELADVTAGD